MIKKKHLTKHAQKGMIRLIRPELNPRNLANLARKTEGKIREIVFSVYVQTPPTINPRIYTQTYTPTVVQGKGLLHLPLGFRGVTIFRKYFIFNRLPVM